MTAVLQRRVTRRRLPRAGRAVAAILLGLFVAASGTLVRAEELALDGPSGLRYLEVLTGGALHEEPLPIVVAMHGLGDHPETFRLFLDKLPARARLVFPRGPLPRGSDGFSWFDFHDANDTEGVAELSEGLGKSAERVATLIASLSQRFGGPARVVVCGFSQGGMMSFALAARHPEQVAAAIPVSGFLPPPLWPAERPKTRPLPKVLALHGETDRLIPLEFARWSVEALRSNGYDVSLRSWPKVGHAMPLELRAVVIEAVGSAVEELSPPGSLQEGQARRKETGQDTGKDQQGQGIPGQKDMTVPQTQPPTEAPATPAP